MDVNGMDEIARNEAAAEAARRAAEAEAQNQSSSIGTAVSDFASGTLEVLGAIGEVLGEVVAAIAE